MTRCLCCAVKTSASAGYCRTCKSRRFHARKRIEAEGLIIDVAGGAWWVWDAKGKVIVIGKGTKTAAFNALAMGEDAEEDVVVA